MKEKKQKKSVNSHAQIIFKDYRLYIGLGILFLFLISGLLAFPQYNKFVELKADLKQIIGEIEGDNENGQFYGLRSELKKVEAEYIETKKMVDKLNEEKLAILTLAFPEEEEISFLTQLLEGYAVEHDSINNPFEMTNISFSKAKSPTKLKPKPGEKPKPAPPIAYSIIQINLPIVASKSNFEEFIRFIQKSGSLDQADFYREEFAVPLMTIESLNFTYSEDPEDSSQELVNASFIINTYIRQSSTSNVKSK